MGADDLLRLRKIRWEPSLIIHNLMQPIMRNNLGRYRTRSHAKLIGTLLVSYQHLGLGR